MAEKRTQSGVHINLSPALDKKLSIVARIMPAKSDGKRWFKKDIVALACEKFVDKFLGYLNGAATFDEMIDKAKELNPYEIDIEVPLAEVGAEAESDTDGDLPEETPGLKEF